MSAHLPARETLPHLIRTALADFRPDALVERVDDVWTEISTERILERAENLACAIRASGLDKGDRVALIAHNCADWIVCDFATLMAGCVVVPVYPTQALDMTGYILKHSEAKLLFVDTPALLGEFKAAAMTLPKTVVFESAAADGLAAFEAMGAAIRASNPELPRTYEEPLTPDDLAVLIYTSGTTGQPKGVMLAHDNLVFDSRSSLDYAFEGIASGDTVISVLPYSHIYEHTMIYIYLLAKVRYAICHDPNELVRDLLDVRPVAMTCVPRIFDRVLAGIGGKAMQAGGAQAKLVPWALSTGRDYMRATELGKGAGAWLSLQYALAKKLVLAKVTPRLGLDRLRYFTSGSAALHIDTALTYLGMGIHILQGYGLTETSPVITVNRYSDNRLGTVGRPIPGAEVQIAPDGEVLARGRMVMRGYYLDEAATQSVMSGEWFHTGDIGEVDAEGFLKITDRKKEVFKTATGKYVAPSRVEAALKRSLFIGQALVVGDGRPHPAALIVPNWDMLRVELSLPKSATLAELAQRDDVQSFLAGQAREKTQDLASFERIRRVMVIPEEFTVANGQLSPSMKIKRREVERAYAARIDEGYTQPLREPAHA